MGNQPNSLKSKIFSTDSNFRNLVIQKLQFAQRKNISQFLTQNKTLKPKMYFINENYENKPKVLRGLGSKQFAMHLSDFFGNGVFVHPNNQ